MKLFKENSNKIGLGTLVYEVLVDLKLNPIIFPPGERGGIFLSGKTFVDLEINFRAAL